MGAVAGVLYEIFKHEANSNVLSSIVNGGVGIDSLSIQWACVVAVDKTVDLDNVIDHLLSTWSDKVYVNHTPVVAQEGAP